MILKDIKPGHYEVVGETVAQLEFIQQGFNPYTRYLDVDKVDLILRDLTKKVKKYYEVQVKYGRLYRATGKWELGQFDLVSWRFFKENEFLNSEKELFLVYVLIEPDVGYQGDFFIFPIRDFNDIIHQGIKTTTKKGEVKYKIHFAHSTVDDKWYLYKRRNFHGLDEENVLDINRYRRNFDLIRKKNSG